MPSAMPSAFPSAMPSAFPSAIPLFTASRISGCVIMPMSTSLSTRPVFRANSRNSASGRSDVVSAKVSICACSNRQATRPSTSLRHIRSSASRGYGCSPASPIMPSIARETGSQDNCPYSILRVRRPKYAPFCLICRTMSIGSSDDSSMAPGRFRPPSDPVSKTVDTSHGVSSTSYPSSTVLA